MCPPRSGAHDAPMMNDLNVLEVLVNERQRDLRRGGQKPTESILERRARAHHRILRHWRRA
jgi:hypothetical protein